MNVFGVPLRGVQQGIGAVLPSPGDVNPTCNSNEVFVDEGMQGDYWTTYGSQDSEQRTYNANWTRNMLGLQINGRHVQGIGGCQSCGAAKIAPAQRRAQAQRATNQVVSAVNMAAASAQPRGVTADVLIVDYKPVVTQNPPDTRWMQDDYPPTEGPTDADTRCADAWYVSQVVPPEVLNGSLGVDGRPVGVGQELEEYAYSQARACPPFCEDPHKRVPAPGGVNQRIPGPSGNQRIPGPTNQRVQSGGSGNVRTLGGPVGMGVGQGLGAASNPTSPATVGLIAALGGTLGLIVGGALGAEIGSGGGAAAARRAAVGGLIGMLAGAFTGAAVAAPSIQSQGA